MEKARASGLALVEHLAQECIWSVTTDWLIGKVAADHSHKWIYKEPNDQEINFLSAWHNSADSYPRTWEAQFQSGIKTIALISVREGVVQLGSVHKVVEDLSNVVMLRKKLSYIESIPGVLLPHPSSSGYPFINSSPSDTWNFPGIAPPQSQTEHHQQHFYHSDHNHRFLMSNHHQPQAMKITPKTTPGETTPGETTPGETTPSGPPAPAVSSGPPVGPINIESSREDLVQSSERETAEPSVTDGNKKKRSAPDSSASIDSQARTGSDEPPRKKKKKKEKKKRKKSTEGQSEPIGDAEGHEPVVHEGSSRDVATRAVVESSGSPNIPLEKRKKPSCGSDASSSSAKTPSVAPPAPPTTTGGVSASEERRIKFRDRVEFKYDGDTPLAYAPSECAELIRQI
ncbi:hypothetical protein F2Q70_00036348 [Brassica cretica]|uniref:Transcription factor MYC/MYB N-terminal domain-containing protein n=1 Tax=Brassica cretica TaxID=69181 RepID=A0A8S9JZ86_BRACR|nr:hypothetical protein F2Q70_00036348 [Brassica cretica]